MPTKLGQKLIITQSQNENYLLKWQTFTQKIFWNEYIFDTNNDFEIKYTSDKNSAFFIQKVLRTAQSLNPHFYKKTLSKAVKSDIDFDINWGLGSSSTTITNVANWAEIDAFQLNSLISLGSGYDIACAISNKPILFSKKSDKPFVKEIEFKPSFLDNIFFIYTGKKQKTEQSINEFLKNANLKNYQQERISQISLDLAGCADINLAIALLNEHNNIISEILQITPVQKEKFDDFPGVLKSLGAWGGDFLMALSNMASLDVKQYFFNRGFSIIFNYKELAL